MEIKAVLFDLDGVITDTAKYHFKAWEKISSLLGIKLNKNFEESIKGISREESLKEILKYGQKEIGENKFKELMDLKNDIYLKSLENLSKKDILEGIEEFLKKLKEEDIKIIITSSSLNAPFIIGKLNLNMYIDGIVDPSTLKRQKPYPDIYLKACELAGVEEQFCIGIEDAKSGITGINRAGIFSVAIGNIEEADLILKSTQELNYEFIKKKSIL